MHWAVRHFVMPDPDLLTSWKEIAAYLRREVRTVQRWEHNCGLPVHRTPGGRRSSVYAFSEELTAWLSTRENEAETQDDARYRTVFTAAPLAMWLLDDDRTIRDLNEQASKLLEADREGLLGKRLDDFADVSETANLVALWARFLAGDTLEGEFRLRLPSGQTKTVWYSAKPRVLPGLHIGILRQTR
jgi:PAS domain S-box-containing protein